MGYKTLYEALPFLKDVDKDRQAQFKEYFKTAPLWLLDSFQIMELKAGTIFVRENEPVENIFFIGSGTIEAVDYRFCGITYEFMRFDKVYAMGGMEFIMDVATYRTTLKTVTKCIVVKIPRTVFERWMRSDIYALKHEAKCVGEYLLEDSRKSRALLFLQGADRLAMLFKDRYERYAKNGVLRVRGSRQDLSNATGLCVKTINRSIKKFSGEGLVTKDGHQILIDRQQYEGLKAIVEAIVGAG